MIPRLILLVAVMCLTTGKVTLAADAVPSAPAATAAVAAELFPEAVRRVVFLGDSITYRGDYVSDIEAWYRTRHPERRVEILNLGLSSETTSGLSEPGHAGGKFPRPDLHERLGRVLAQTKPDLVIACYGMNDGIYLPLDEARFAAFRDGITRLHRAVEQTGATIIHLTPPIFDEVTGGHPGYSAVLDRYSEWLVSQRTNAWRVIDLHTLMKRALASQREELPTFTFARDGIHPDASGHLLMAKVILTELGATDLSGTTNATAMMAAYPQGAQLLQLIHQQQAVMKDAWLTATGHKRPQKLGLPMAEAQAKAAEIEAQIQNLLPSSK